jgi:GNAT superfamily N-acetyltransferase
MTETMLSMDHVRQHERMEMEYWRDWYEAATPEIAERFGHSIDVAEGAAIAIIARVDILMFNRVLGLGIEKPVSESQLDGIVARYKAAGVPRFFVPVSPAAEPPEVRDWLLERGLTLYNRWAKLERSVDPVPEEATDARIEEIGPDHAQEYGAILRQCFDLPEGLEEWLARLVHRPGWRHYMAFDGAEPIGTASIFFKGEWATLGFAATLPEARGRGVQSALIARRIRDAKGAGVHWLSVETAEERADRPAPSYRNVTRLGFRLGYYRDNYIWKAEGVA